MGTVPLGQIVFGTDYPYASEKVSKTFNANLDHSTLFAPDQVDMINRGAAQLIPRLKHDHRWSSASESR
jgi:aminocarboxymuconate-semialdehyde decarboxylase